MIVVSKRNALFKNSDGESFMLSKDILTPELPGWVAEHAFFKQLCAAGEVTVTESNSDKELYKALEEEKPKRKSTKKK